MTTETQSKTRHRPGSDGLDADGVDLRRPLLPQVAALGDRYDAWVHDSVPPNTASQLRGESKEKWAGSLRIFESDWLEAMSHIYWQLVLVVWIPISTGLFLAAHLGFDVPLGAAFAWTAFGLFLWTFVEYALHRWVFHYIPKSGWGRKIHFLMHGIHHLDPWDGTRLVFPPLAGIVLASPIFGLIKLALPWGPACAVMAGVLVGYIVYDMTHYYTHHATPKSRWGKFLRRYHLAHHHKAWEAMYGVSNPLWDIILRTGEPKSEPEN